MEAAVEKSAMRKIYSAPAAVRDPVLHPGLHRPHQRQLRRPDDARRSQAVRDRLRVCARNVLPRLLHLRGAEQRDHGESRRADMDRAHHDHVGHLRRRHGFRLRHDELLHRQVPARRGRGRLLPGHAALLHLLVPAPAPRAHRIRVPGGPAGGGRARRADLDGAAQSRRPVRASRAGRSCTSPRRSRPSWSAS